MTDDNILPPWFWRHVEGKGWFIACDNGSFIRHIAGPFSEEEAMHAGWIWGVPFTKEAEKL